MKRVLPQSLAPPPPSISNKFQYRLTPSSKHPAHKLSPLPSLAKKLQADLRGPLNHVMNTEPPIPTPHTPPHSTDYVILLAESTSFTTSKTSVVTVRIRWEVSIHTWWTPTTWTPYCLSSPQRPGMTPGPPWKMHVEQPRNASASSRR